MTEQEILAKSTNEDGSRPLTLREHIDDLLGIWVHLQIALPQSPQLAQLPEFWDLLRAAIVFHDIGKGHKEFQRILKGEKMTKWEGQRHELFSLPFLQMLKLPKPHFDMVERVVAGHHRTFEWLNEHCSDNYTCEEDYAEEFDKVNIEVLKNLIASYGFKISDVKAKRPNQIFSAYYRERMSATIPLLHQLLLLAGAFKHCDHLASAFVKPTDLKILALQHFRFVEQKITRPYEHQTFAGETFGSAILTAPTGSGKTETAILWLRRHWQEEKSGLVYYVLPFTASINAMWQRLGSKEKGFGDPQLTGMIHGNLSAILYRHLLEENGDPTLIREKIKKIREQFKTMMVPLRVVTPFQLLRHIFGLKGFEKGIYEWTGGYFIFDEIHAYEPAIFAQIVVLLEYAVKECGVRVFVMTATLPSFLKNLIVQCIGNASQINASVELYNKFIRHRVKVFEGQIIDKIQLIENDLNAGKKVLVVCNTVLRAQSIYAQLIENSKFKEQAILLHSAFNSEDRARIENKLKVENYDDLPALLVGTQAIEVSLDIDYDIIYTELAPLDALLQRFGRVNRAAKKEPSPCYIFAERNEKDKFIYSEETCERTLISLQKLQALNEGIIEEACLQEEIDFVYPDFDEKSKREFEKVRDALRNSLQQLVPFHEDSLREDDFYRQFDGVKVIPSELWPLYKERISNFKFMEAEFLKVGIRKCEVARWMRDEVLTREAYPFPIKTKTGEQKIENCLIVHLKYDTDLGLLKNERLPASATFIDEQINF